MAKITFCWELGGGYGHIASFKPLADRLLDREHTVSAVLRYCDYANTFFEGMPLAYSAAPMWVPVREYTSPTISYADIITRHGYDSVASLLPLVEQWRENFLSYGTELVIVDHSPTALVAARTLNIPITLFGTGFCAPPPVYPLPSITPWLNSDEDFLIKIELDVVTVINKVLKHFGVSEIKHLHELFDVDENFLCTFPELDHYDGRSMDGYWGPIFNDGSGATVNNMNSAWPNAKKKKVFVYTKNEYEFVNELLTSFKSINADFVVHCAGFNAEDTACYECDNVIFSIEPVQMKSIAGHADLVVCHAGHGTIASSLLMGIPLLLMPTQLEQSLLASKISAFNLSRFISMDDNKPNFTSVIESLLVDEACKKQTLRFAEQYRGFSQDEQLEEVVFACEDLL